MPPSSEAPLVAKMFDKSVKDAELRDAIANLSPEEAQFFLHKLQQAFRKRKIQLTGYLAAMFVWLVGTILAIAYYGTHDGFVGWVFLLPFTAVGVILYGVGSYADRVGKAPPPAELVEAARAAKAARRADKASDADAPAKPDAAN